MVTTITITKNDHNGKTAFEYPMQIVEQGADWICLEGHFNISKSYDLGVFTIETGDRSVEWFYSNRYYNIFRLYRGDSDQLKGFYCNITRPAIITTTTVTADDLALDILVSPTGEIVLHDEDEFKALNLTADERKHALEAVETIRHLVDTRQSPFDVMTK